MPVRVRQTPGISRIDPTMNAGMFCAWTMNAFTASLRRSSASRVPMWPAKPSGGPKSSRVTENGGS